MKRSIFLFTSVLCLLFGPVLRGAGAFPIEASSTGNDGSLSVQRELPRESFQAKNEQFAARFLNVTLECVAPGEAPVQFVVFTKDKDGVFFQSAQEFEIRPGEKKHIELEIAPELRLFLPQGHQARWERFQAGRVCSIGVNAYHLGKRAVKLILHDASFSGETPFPSPELSRWQLPERAEARRMFESRFAVNREYFNPFDPDEVSADYRVTMPDGTEKLYPAFYTQDHTRELRFNNEFVTAHGHGYWAFRFAPPMPGTYTFRLNLSEPKTGKTVVSEARSLIAVPPATSGFVRVSKRNPYYFELDNGEQFIPIGLNIHTNTDLRSEYRFLFGHLPDRGTFDYDDYFSAGGAAGINVIEVWMASWTFAFEWDAARKDYHGVGRYNLANAWRLDHLIDSARRHGIRLNLVLDNHGKFVVYNDQEWDDNPYNIKSVFHKANGGFIQNARDYFSDPRARELELKRNRYIAARYGADPAIMTVQLWSEVDLVDGFRDLYDNGVMEQYHSEVARHYVALDQGKHLITTHVCGDAQRMCNYRRLYDVPEFTHVAGDAYRGVHIHFADQLRKHRDMLHFPKPLLITEYGGTSQAADFARVTADVHVGQWAAIFAGQAGSPFLWWHDYVHIHNLYGHYRAAANYLKYVELRVPDMKYVDGEVVGFSEDVIPEKLTAFSPLDLNRLLERNLMLRHFKFKGDLRYDAMCAGRYDRLYGYVFNRQPTLEYPQGGDSSFIPAGNLALKSPIKLDKGKYRLRHFDGATGGIVRDTVISIDQSAPLIPLPVFRIDCAFTLEKMP